MQKSRAARTCASTEDLQQRRLRPRSGAKIKLPKGGTFKAALKLIGPSPVGVAALIWQSGWKRLEKLASQANSWDVSVVAAAILTLTENRPGMVEFWEDYRDAVRGWPRLLSIASSNVDLRSRSWERRVELALYVTQAYTAHRSDARMTLLKLMDQRESLPQYRVQALQSTFIGLPARMQKAAARTNQPAKHYEYKRIRVKNGDGRDTTVSLELELYADVCRAIGRTTTHRVVRSVASTYKRQEEKLKLSAVVQQELMALVRENIEGAVFIGVQDAPRFIAADPRAKERRVERTTPRREMTSRERRERYGTHYGKTYLTVAVPLPTGRRTAVSISKALIEKATIVLPRRQVNAMIGKAAQSWRIESGLTLSEHAREGLMYQLCQLPQAAQLRVQ